MNGRRWLTLALATVALTALLVATAFAAQTPGQDPPGPGRWDGHDRFLDNLAARLNLERTELDEAIKDAAGQTLDEAVEAGRLTQEQAERLRARLERDGFWPGPPPRIHGPGLCLKQAAAALGIQPRELLRELRQGKSLAAIAAERGVALSEVKEKVLAAVKERLDQAVAGGRLTQEQADQILQRTEQRIHSENWPCPHPSRMSGFGRGPWHGKGPGFMKPF